MLPTDPAALPLLHHGRLDVTGRIIDASNATLLCTVHCDGVSAVTYTETRPFVQRVNDCGDDLRSLVPPKRRRRRRPSSDATPGGCTGTS